MTSDDHRANFLLALDRSDEVQLSGFELDFVASNLDRFSFSPKQRPIIDRLIEKYGNRIRWNENSARKLERLTTEDARRGAQFEARAGRPRPTEHVTEAIQKVDGKLKLSHAPIKMASVMRNGRRLEDHWIDHATGTFNNCPFLAAGDPVEYDYYLQAHG